MKISIGSHVSRIKKMVGCLTIALSLSGLIVPAYAYAQSSDPEAQISAASAAPYVLKRGSAKSVYFTKAFGGRTFNFRQWSWSDGRTLVFFTEDSWSKTKLIHATYKAKDAKGVWRFFRWKGGNFAVDTANPANSKVTLASAASLAVDVDTWKSDINHDGKKDWSPTPILPPGVALADVQYYYDSADIKSQPIGSGVGVDYLKYFTYRKNGIFYITGYLKDPDNLLGVRWYSFTYSQYSTEYDQFSTLLRAWFAEVGAYKSDEGLAQTSAVVATELYVGGSLVIAYFAPELEVNWQTYWWGVVTAGGTIAFADGTAAKNYSDAAEKVLKAQEDLTRFVTTHGKPLFPPN